MYHRLLEEYLTHYQPYLKEELLRTGTLQRYLEEQNTIILEMRRQMVMRLMEMHPQMSPLQRELEAEQAIRELYLTPS